MSQLHCAIDLELEQPKSNSQTPDSLLDKEQIIQVGYVIYAVEPEFKIVEEVSRFVNIGVPLSSFIKQLTKITDKQLQEEGRQLVDIYSEMVGKTTQHGCYRVVTQWGGGDMDSLKSEIGDVPWLFGRSALNIKHVYQMYAEANGLNRSGGLKKCLNRLNIPWSHGSAHNALTDAVNTAKIHHFLHHALKCRNN